MDPVVRLFSQLLRIILKWYFSKNNLQTMLVIEYLCSILSLIKELFNYRADMTDISSSYLVANGFWAAPLQENLLYTTGTGHSKTLRALQFRLWILRSSQEKCNLLCDKLSLISETEDMDRDEMEKRFEYTYFVGSEFILSKRARLAWAPLERGSVWDFITSCLNSNPPALFAFLWRNSEQQPQIHVDWSYQ